MKPNNIKYISLLFFVFFGIHAFANEPEIEEEIIEFCNFEMPKVLAQANASFSVVYSMDIDSTGTPINIKLAYNNNEKIMSDEPFIECFQKWKLPSSHGKVDVYFYWKHAVGWTTMSIAGKNVSRKWSFQPGWQAGIKRD